MKKLIISLLLAAIAGTATAQWTGKMVKYSRGKLTVIPQAFSYGGKVTLGFTEEKNKYATAITLVDENFNEKNTISPDTVSFITFWLMDWRSSFGEDEEFLLSQTLFNDDEAIEYAIPLTKSETEEIDYDGDGVIDLTETRYQPIGFRVCSEDGTVLQEVMFDNNFTCNASYYDGLDMRVLLMGDKCYLIVSGKCDGEDATMFYDIDHKTGSTSRCDVNEDGAVDVADIATVISEMAARSR